jgi:hypothetical protein
MMWLPFAPWIGIRCGTSLCRHASACIVNAAKQVPLHRRRLRPEPSFLWGPLRFATFDETTMLRTVEDKQVAGIHQNHKCERQRRQRNGTPSPSHRLLAVRWEVRRISPMSEGRRGPDVRNL